MPRLDESVGIAFGKSSEGEGLGPVKIWWRDYPKLGAVMKRRILRRIARFVMYWRDLSRPETACCHLPCGHSPRVRLEIPGNPSIGGAK